MSYGLKEAYEEGFSDGSLAGDDRYDWGGFRDELSKLWSESEAYTYTQSKTSQNKEPMKDHEFREQVNLLRDLAINYAQTGQLRERMAVFLKEFKDKVEQ